MRASAEHETSAEPSNGVPLAEHQPRASWSVRVPQHVVYRSLATETVVLNVQTGIYYGLNQTAGRMLEVLERFGDVERAITELAKEFDVADEVIREDLQGLCGELEQKGLIEVNRG